MSGSEGGTVSGDRSLVLCFDGTWNSDDARSPTNVVHTSRAISSATAAGVPQVVHYDRGVGTGRFDRLGGGIVGLGLARNVELAYAWLVANRRPGDRLFLFGYSRGAYTARSLAGLIGLCGIPAAADGGAGSGLHEASTARQGMAIYRMPGGPERSERAARFREALCPPEGSPGSGDFAGDGGISAGASSSSRHVHFIGVWDTVGSLGVPITWLNWIGARRHRFHDVRLDRHIRHACHAVSIDEGRRPFAPSLWRSEPSPGQSVEQLWFPGVHGDVGGGRASTGLSDGALLWMWAKAHAAGLALRNQAVVAGPAPDPSGPQGRMSAVYRIWGRYDRPIGERESGGRSVVTGEGVHFSTMRRLEGPDADLWRQGVAGRTLLPALKAKRVRVASPLPGEEDPALLDWSAPPPGR